MSKILIALLFIVAFLAVDRARLAELRQFLILDITLEENRPQLRYGMSADEAKRIVGLPPDDTYKPVDGSGKTELVWRPRKHVGIFHELFGMNVRDEKSFSELWLSFDASGKLFEIYYGG